MFALYTPLHRLFLPQLSSQPQQLPDGKWNCSVPHWPDFRLHFRCNLVRECAGGEDEASCPYSLCDDGGVSLDNSCFHLMDPGRSTSWDESNLACSRMGGRLASLTTPAERRRVTHYLRCNRSGQFQTFLGLKSAPVALPDMYVMHFVCRGCLVLVLTFSDIKRNIYVMQSVCRGCLVFVFSFSGIKRLFLSFSIVLDRLSDV